jgi:hypothetical protein
MAPIVCISFFHTGFSRRQLALPKKARRHPPRENNATPTGKLVSHLSRDLIFKTECKPTAGTAVG